MKYFIIFLVSTIIGLAIFLSLGLQEFNGWFLLIVGFQWVTQYILPWAILILLINIARK